jgi:hypothetical protein
VVAEADQIISLSHNRNQLFMIFEKNDSLILKTIWITWEGVLEERILDLTEMVLDHQSFLHEEYQQNEEYSEDFIPFYDLLPPLIC